MILKNKVYDVVKSAAQIYLPALGTLYFALAGIWHLPSADEVVGTIVAVDTFLGVALGISTKQYNSSDNAHDGYIGSTGVDPDTGIPDLQLTITKDPNEILKGETAQLKVGLPPNKPADS